jgi:hypothetical protein
MYEVADTDMNIYKINVTDNILSVTAVQKKKIDIEECHETTTT